MKRALLILEPDHLEWVFPSGLRTELGRRLEFLAPPLSAESLRRQPALKRDVEIIVASWGAPTLDEEFLDAAPKLEAVFYAAGSIREIVTPAFWRRRIVIASAYALNAVPVAQFTLAAAIFGLKHAWTYAVAARELHRFPALKQMPGTFGTTIGLVSLGQVGRLVARHLLNLGYRVVAYDPFLSEAEAGSLGVGKIELDPLFAVADVVSLHTPLLPSTVGLITGRHFAAMKPGATFINTARGAVVREEEMIACLKDRPDLTAVLDVTESEPPARDSPLYTLPNVMLTPHLAGCRYRECTQLGHAMIEEIDRHLAGQPLKWAITESLIGTLA